MGPDTEPWGTPHDTFVSDFIQFVIFWERKSLSFHVTEKAEIPRLKKTFTVSQTPFNR